MAAPESNSVSSQVRISRSEVRQKLGLSIRDHLTQSLLQAKHLTTIP